MSPLSIPRKNQPPINPIAEMSERRRRSGLHSLRHLPNPHLLTIVALCIIVLLVALNLIFLFPDFGAVIEQYNQF